LSIEQELSEGELARKRWEAFEKTKVIFLVLMCPEGKRDFLRKSNSFLLKISPFTIFLKILLSNRMTIHLA